MGSEGAGEVAGEQPASCTPLHPLLNSGASLTCLCCLSTMPGQELKHSADKDVRELSGSQQILCARGKVTEKREVAEMEIRRFGDGLRDLVESRAPAEHRGAAAPPRDYREPCSEAFHAAATPAGKGWGNLALSGGCRAPDGDTPGCCAPRPGSTLSAGRMAAATSQRVSGCCARLPAQRGESQGRSAATGGGWGIKGPFCV